MKIGKQTPTWEFYPPTGRPAAGAASAESQPAVGTDLVSLSGTPLVPSGEALGQVGRETALHASPGHDLVARYFSQQEFAALNPGAYHNTEHPVHVARVAGHLSPERKEFLEQVALVHDADPRAPGTPARAQVTLEWMEKNQPALQTRFAWDDTQFVEAQALIARTDFPFDDKPRQLGTRFDGMSPVQVYAHFLEKLPADRRQQVMDEGLALRMADQIGNYTVSPQVSEKFVEGLASELKIADAESFKKQTPAFLNSAGKDVAADQKLAQQFGVELSNLSAEEMIRRLPAEERAALTATQEWLLSG